MSDKHPGMAMLERIRALADARAEELAPATRPFFDGAEHRQADPAAVLEHETAIALKEFCDQVQGNPALIKPVCELLAIAARKAGAR
jgi:hypothetical protein